MVREFDQVVFSAPLNVVQGPVKTQFGYHLLEVTSRQDWNVRRRITPPFHAPIQAWGE